MSETIPEGWKAQSLDGNIEILSGFPFKSSLFSNDARKIGLIRIRDLETQSLETFYDGDFDQTYVIRKGDILIGMDGDFNIVKWKAMNALLNQRICKIKASEGSNFLTDFLFHSLGNDLQKIHAETGATTVKHLSVKDIRAIEKAYPPLPEQQKIATILSSVDGVIEKTRAQIDKLKDLKTGMMQELLTKGIGHTEFKDSPMGRVPKKWILKKFSEITLKIQDGTHFSPQSKTGSFLYITSKNIQNGKLELDNISFISKEEHDEIYRRCDVSYGDILLTKDGANTGNCAINTLKEPFSLLSSVAFLRCKQDLCFNEYIYQYISSPIFQKTIKDSMTGNAITRLTLSLIRSFLIPLPEISEQREIVKALSSIDSRVNSVNANLDKLLMLKKALMQDLLTGKVRVNVDNSSEVAAV